MEYQKEEMKNLTETQEDYIEVENHCCLCGTELIFEHDAEPAESFVVEKAHCPCCKIQLKEKEHTVH